MAPTIADAEPLVFSGSYGTRPLEVENARAVFMHGIPSVEFAATEEASAVMGDLTGAMVGETLTISLCDRVLVEAVVRERISGRGIVNLPNAETAVAVADVLKGDADCGALDPLLDE